MEKEDLRTYELLEDCQYRLDQFHTAMMRFSINDEESHAWAEKMMNAADTIKEELDKFADDHIEFNENLTAEYKNDLDYSRKILEEALQIIEKKRMDYAKRCEALGNRSVLKQIEKDREAPEGDQTITHAESSLEDFRHSLVMVRADVLVKGIIGMPSRLENQLSRFTLNKQKRNWAYKNLKKARDHLNTALRDLPASYKQSINNCIKELENVLPNLMMPAHRHENVILNNAIVAVMDYFLENNYSKKQSYAYTGELLVRNRLLEENEYLSDRVRHRYLNRKKKGNR